eukprot:scaffold353802_cov50-Prasinocladus_malaysianus.AAC.1
MKGFPAPDEVEVAASVLDALNVLLVPSVPGTVVHVFAVRNGGLRDFIGTLVVGRLEAFICRTVAVIISTAAAATEGCKDIVGRLLGELAGLGDAREEVAGVVEEPGPLRLHQPLQARRIDRWEEDGQPRQHEQQKQARTGAA